MSTLGAALNAPLSAVDFVIEITRDVNLPPLLLRERAPSVFRALTLRCSVLTEKMSRRGYHLRREYTVDPSPRLSLRAALDSQVIALPVSAGSRQSRQCFPTGEVGPQQRYSTVDAAGRLAAVATRAQVQRRLGVPQERAAALSAIRLMPAVAYPDGTPRAVAPRLAKSGLKRSSASARRQQCRRRCRWREVAPVPTQATAAPPLPVRGGRVWPDG